MVSYLEIILLKKRLLLKYFKELIRNNEISPVFDYLSQLKSTPQNSVFFFVDICTIGRADRFHRRK